MAESLDSLYQFIRHPETPANDFYQSFGFLDRCKADDRLLTLFHTNSAWDVHGLRAVMAMDYKNQQLYWSFTFGPYLTHHRIVDLDNDGTDEILLSTYASNNGIKGQSSSDDSSFVFLLDHRGRLLWQRNIGGFWTGAHADVGDIDGDGQLEIVCFQTSNRTTESDQDRVFLLDPQTGKVQLQKRVGDRFLVGTSIKSNICTDLTGDGKDEIVIGNSDGYLRVFDETLNVILQSERYDGHLVIEGVQDFLGDGIAEIVAILRDEKIILFDRQLHKLCDFPLSPESGTILKTLKGRNKHYLLLQALHENKQRASLLELQRSIFPFPGSEKYNRYIVFLLILFPVFALGLYGKYRHSLNDYTLQNLKILPQQITDFMLVVKKNGKLFYQGKRVADFMPFLASGGQNIFDRDNKDQQLYQDLLQNKKSAVRINQKQTICEIRSFRFYRSPLIGLYFIDLAEHEHVAQVKLWARVAQRLAHGIKNPLTSVKLNAQEVQYFLKTKYQINDDTVSDSLESIVAQVSKLKRMSDGFMRFVEFEHLLLKSLDINPLLEQWIQEWHPGHCDKIHLSWDLDKDLAPVKIDVEQFAFAFRNIYFNAVESIEEKGSIIISTRQVQVISETNTIREYVEIQVQDTGKGIPVEYLHKIRQPYFSLKPEGTGLGLAIVEKIMTSHQGEMKIYSQHSSGTTITLRLPI